MHQEERKEKIKEIVEMVSQLPEKELAMAAAYTAGLKQAVVAFKSSADQCEAR